MQVNCVSTICDGTAQAESIMGENLLNAYLVFNANLLKGYFMVPKMVFWYP